MIYVILGLFAIYYLLILFLVAGWTKAVGQNAQGPTGSSAAANVSVIVPFRNEATNLKSLLTSLSAQTYLSYEVILVDDHSDDDGVAFVTELCRDQPNIRVIGNVGTGKKEALTSGIGAARGEIIVTTDADCLHTPGWLTSMVEPFADDRIQMTFSAVKIDGVTAPMQSLEFMSVVATGVALFAMGKPTYCNGASMAFRRSVFLEVGGYHGNLHIPSGDDEFLLRKVAAAYPKGLRFVKSADSIVQTSPQSSIGRFVHQRIRWAGKWKLGMGGSAKALAVFMFLFQIGCIGAWAMVLNSGNFRMAGFLLMGKFILDFVFLFNAGKFLNEKVRLIPFLAIQALYPFYVLGIGLAANFSGYSWKGRFVATNPKLPKQL
jgi:cellulose synthase/poly-beta-1,6-N-acetylglucosamine synthase-like glycosyltransferase